MRNRINLTTEEAKIIVDLLKSSHPLQARHHNLIEHIESQYIKTMFVDTLPGLPTEEQFKEAATNVNSILFLANPKIFNRKEFVGHFGEEGYSVFESLGDDAGSDDDPLVEFETYEELAQWWETYNKP